MRKRNFLKISFDMTFNWKICIDFNQEILILCQFLESRDVNNFKMLILQTFSTLKIYRKSDFTVKKKHIKKGSSSFYIFISCI